MTIAQLSARTRELQATVGIGNELAQQILLRVGLSTAIQFTSTMLDIPEHIIYLPHAIQLLCGEKRHEIGMVAEMGIQDEKSHLHQIIVEERLIHDFLHDVWVLENSLHQTTVSHARSYVGIVCLLCLWRHIVLARCFVLIV